MGTIAIIGLVLAFLSTTGLLRPVLEAITHFFDALFDAFSSDSAEQGSAGIAAAEAAKTGQAGLGNNPTQKCKAGEHQSCARSWCTCPCHGPHGGAERLYSSKPPVPQPLPPPSAPAGWIPDPRGRHELRYWDGSRWTEHVSDASVPGLDPL